MARAIADDASVRAAERLRQGALDAATLVLREGRSPRTARTVVRRRGRFVDLYAPAVRPRRSHRTVSSADFAAAYGGRLRIVVDDFAASHFSIEAWLHGAKAPIDLACTGPELRQVAQWASFLVAGRAWRPRAPHGLAACGGMTARRFLAKWFTSKAEAA